MAVMSMWKHDGFLERALVMLLLLAFSGPSMHTLCAMSLGINYGKVANNLPAPAEVVRIIQSIYIKKAKLYDADPLVLNTFRNTDISFLVGVANEDLPGLASLATAENWIAQNVLPYHPSTNINGIVVGNEIFSGTDTAQMSQVLPAMKNIYTVLTNLNLQRQIVVSTTHSFAVLTSSYPPSTGAFNPAIATLYMEPILQFLTQTGAPFMINAYPFFAYKDNSNTVSLDYVLFNSNQGVVDSSTGLRYTNMFDAQLDAVYSAMAALGYKNVSVLVSETGWPSAGDADEPGATVQNSQIYHMNLFNHLMTAKGTPLRPNTSYDVYLFALFNEDMKTGPTSERHYGLFQPDGTKVYNFDFSALSSSSSYPSVKQVLVGSCFFLVLAAIYF